MLLKQETLRRIADGSVTLVYRRWKRPTVRAGGTLLTSIGQLDIESVDRVETDELTDEGARAAGYQDVASLRRELDERPEGRIYRIRVALAGPDPREALRQSLPGADELDDLVRRVGRWRWAPAALQAISNRPAVRAADLAARVGMETSRFKANVRRLKALGLTESLEIGYRLSPRGTLVLERLEEAAPGR